MSFSISTISRLSVLPAVAQKIKDRLNIHIYNCSYIDPSTGKPNKYFHTHDQVATYTQGLNLGPIVLKDFLRNGEQFLLIPFNGKDALFPDGLIQDFRPWQLRDIRKQGGRTFHPTTKESFTPLFNHSHIKGKNCFILDFESDDRTIQLISNNVTLENCENVVVIGGRDLKVQNCSNLIIVDCENTTISNQKNGFFQENNLSNETNIELPDDMYANFDFEISDFDFENLASLDEQLAKQIGVKQSSLGKLFDQIMKDNPALLDRLIREGGADLDFNHLVSRAKIIIERQTKPMKKSAKS